MPFFYSSDTRKKILLNSALFLLVTIAALAMLSPTYRAFFKVVISCNEGWNAFFGAAAIHTGTPYPPPEELITNNYPPLSFYFVGYLGSLLGDLILAGRLISLLSVCFLGLFIGKLIKQLGGNSRDAIVGRKTSVKVIIS
ncbi:MAG: hypothetical protein NT164_00505 [Verrucomicrobiae bacterium]|nr:hypothetical protein [Verrucomicrobiae bacterium]